MAIYQFDMVYRGLFTELLKFGKIVDLVICANLYEPLRGSLYVAFDDPKAGEKCRKLMNQRYYDGQPVKPVVLSEENLDDIVCQPSLKGNCPSTAQP